MKTTFLLSTARRVLGFQMRNVLLSFWLKPYTIPYNELGGVFYMDKRPRADDSDVRQVAVFAVKHLIRCFHLERRMRDPIAQV